MALGAERCPFGGVFSADFPPKIPSFAFKAFLQHRDACWRKGASNGCRRTISKGLGLIAVGHELVLGPEAV